MSLWLPNGRPHLDLESYFNDLFEREMGCRDGVLFHADIDSDHTNSAASTSTSDGPNIEELLDKIREMRAIVENSDIPDVILMLRSHWDFLKRNSELSSVLGRSPSPWEGKSGGFYRTAFIEGIRVETFVDYLEIFRRSQELIQNEVKHWVVTDPNLKSQETEVE